MRSLPPLARAVANGPLDACIALIKSGADVNDGGPLGSPLHIAAEKGQIPWCRVLIDAGANLDALNARGWTALGLAARAAYTETCRVLVDAGADPYLTSADGDNALTLAFSLRGDKLGEILPILLSADRFAEKWSPAHVREGLDSALRYYAGREPRCCQLLIDAGADVNSPDKSGSTPLHHAAAKDKVDICKYLVRNGADVNLSVKCGASDSLTPFQLAVRSGAVNAVTYFLEQHGEDPAQRTAEGRTMAQLAGKHLRTKEVLKASKVGRAISSLIATPAEDVAALVQRRSMDLSL